MANKGLIEQSSASAEQGVRPIPAKCAGVLMVGRAAFSGGFLSSNQLRQIGLSRTTHQQVMYAVGWLSCINGKEIIDFHILNSYHAICYLLINLET
jgi:hypothetical protein